MTLGRAAHALPVEAPAAAMATGIVSLTLREQGWPVASALTSWIAAALWAVLGAALLARWLRDRARAAVEVRQPGVLTLPAATCVLGSLLATSGWRWAGAALLVAAAVQWVLLAPRVLRVRRTSATGAGFLVTVSTAALAVLALALHGAWLRVPAAALAAFAAGLYVVVLARFDRGELLRGRGDQWIAGGALAILALALAGLSAPLAVAAWAGASAWLPALVACEVARPRLGYDARRWATVFPLGMYSVASAAVAGSVPAGVAAVAGHVAFWLAIAVWTATAIGAARRVAGELG